MSIHTDRIFPPTVDQMTDDALAKKSAEESEAAVRNGAKELNAILKELKS